MLARLAAGLGIAVPFLNRNSPLEMVPPLPQDSAFCINLFIVNYSIHNGITKLIKEFLPEFNR